MKWIKLIAGHLIAIPLLAGGMFAGFVVATVFYPEKNQGAALVFTLLAVFGIWAGAKMLRALWSGDGDG